ncbi:MAG: polysaccharide deacetylase family protein [Roseburia sp.]
MSILHAKSQKTKKRYLKRGISFFVALACVVAFGYCMREQVVSGKTPENIRATADEQRKKVAITFDDGPNPDYTELLLEGLAERGVHATFFLLGKEIEKYPQIVEEIHAGGHLIGTHAYEHVNLRNLTDKAAIDQIDKTNSLIHDITGIYPEYIRPPFGSLKSNLDYNTTMIEVLWDIDPLDWKTSNSDVIAKRVITKVQENDIILLHDASESSVKAAFKIIDELQKEGYLFVTVDGILFD